ncbi:HEAT repeat domain-containing protein [Acidobacteria bacterium AH-259-D05]|nr:HEAT repeat domain-containing protein [Acidobacteria bacterium AH-259-D05]
MGIYKRLFCGLVVWAVATTSFPVSAQRPQEVSVDGLIYDLKHPEGERRKEAAALLGQHRARKAVPALIELTEDSDDLIRLAAVRALVRINDTRALNTHIRLTHDPKKAIQEKAIEGIINIYVVEESGFIGAIKKFVDAVNPFSDDYNPLLVEPFVPVSRNALDALAGLLTWPDSGIRKDAAIGLGILRGHSALPAIQEALSRETSDGVKVQLIRALYKIADVSAAQAILPLIRDPDKKVHDEAIFTLGRLQAAEAAPALKQLYESGVEERKTILGFVPISGNDDLQKKLLEALAYIGHSSCRELFLNALLDSQDTYRLYGAEGLGRIGDPSHITQIGRSYLREESSSVKLALSFALFRLGREEHLIEIVDALDKDQAFYYLLELDSSEVEKLYPYLRTADHSARVRLLEIVGLRGNPSAVPIIREMAKSPNSELSSAANLALRRIEGRNASD